MRFEVDGSGCTGYPRSISWLRRFVLGSLSEYNGVALVGDASGDSL